MPAVILYGLLNDKGEYERQFKAIPNREGAVYERLAYYFDKAGDDLSKLKKYIKKSDLSSLFDEHVFDFKELLEGATTIEEVRKLCWFREEDCPIEIVDESEDTPPSISTKRRKRILIEEMHDEGASTKRAHTESSHHASSSCAIAALVFAELDNNSPPFISDPQWSNLRLAKMKLAEFIENLKIGDDVFSKWCQWLAPHKGSKKLREALLHPHLKGFVDWNSFSESLDKEALNFLQSLKANLKSKRSIAPFFLKYVREDTYRGFSDKAPPIDYLKALFPHYLLPLLETKLLRETPTSHPATIAASVRKAKGSSISDILAKYAKRGGRAYSTGSLISDITATLQKTGAPKRYTIEECLEMYLGGVTPLIASMFLVSKRVLTTAQTHQRRKGSINVTQNLEVEELSTYDLLSSEQIRFLKAYEESCIKFVNERPWDVTKTLLHSGIAIPIPRKYETLINQELNSEPTSWHKELVPYLEQRRIPNCGEWFYKKRADEDFFFSYKLAKERIGSRVGKKGVHLKVPAECFALQLKPAIELIDMLRSYPYRRGTIITPLFGIDSRTSLWTIHPRPTQDAENSEEDDNLSTTSSMVTGSSARSRASTVGVSTAFSVLRPSSNVVSSRSARVLNTRDDSVRMVREEESKAAVDAPVSSSRASGVNISTTSRIPRIARFSPSAAPKSKSRAIDTSSSSSQGGGGGLSSSAALETSTSIATSSIPLFAAPKSKSRGGRRAPSSSAAVSARSASITTSSTTLVGFFTSPTSGGSGATQNMNNTSTTIFPRD